MIPLRHRFAIFAIITAFSIGPLLADSNPDADVYCPTQEEINENDISIFRDNYIPQEFHPVPAYISYIDLSILVCVLSLGIFMICRRRPRRELTILALVSFGYFGLVRGGCICPVGAVSNITIGVVYPELIGRVTILLFLIPLVAALIAGRVFCTAGCPLGAIQHVIQKKKKYVVLPRWLCTVSLITSAVILVATIWLMLQSNLMLVCLLDPYKALFFTGHAWIMRSIAFVSGASMASYGLWACGTAAWLFLFVMLILGYWVPRPFCRFICPYGVLLGCISVVAYKRRRIEKEKCSFCGLCERECPTQAISIDRKSEVAKLSNYSCIQCNRCICTCGKQAIR